MRRNRMRWPGFLGSALLALGAEGAWATAIQDLVWIKGQERVVVTGLGIVIGLDGTGDTGKDSLVAARPFSKLLTNLGNSVGDVQELSRANAFAIVAVTMRIPPAGARDGDRLDVSVEKLFNAESLAGGRLVVSILRLPGPDSAGSRPIAFAEGPLSIQGDNPASAVVRQGGQMIVDIRTNPVTAEGTMTLVLENQYAGYPVAIMIANAINDEFGIDGLSNIAFVEDAKNLRIHIPADDRTDPAQFIAMLLTIPIDPSLIQTEARIVINERAGIVTVTGDVEIGPVAITHRGMQLSSIAPAGGGAAGGGRWIGVDTTGRVGRASTRLTDLLAAFDQLNVSTDDQIAIIHELQKTGALHAEIVTE